jgi:hypothetical protein
LRQWLITPDIEDATIWGDCVATATAGGMPQNIRKGVRMKPPPTPNMPERKPTAAPRPMIRNTFTGISAMGR